MYMSNLFELIVVQGVGLHLCAFLTCGSTVTVTPLMKLFIVLFGLLSKIS